jgi:hypothetical protein
VTRAGLAVLVLAALTLAPAAQARRIELMPDIPSATHIAARAPLAHAANVLYGNGTVLNSNRTHLIFWQPADSGLAFDPGYIQTIETFLQRVAHDSRMPTNEYALTGQYDDAQGPAAYASTYGGAVLDTDKLPRNECTMPSTGPPWKVCLTDTQLELELDHVIKADHLPTAARDIFFVVTPDGFGDCAQGDCSLGGPQTGYCGYHFSTPNNVPYAVIPYNAIENHCQSDNPRPNGSTADPTLSTISHEQAEMITDPFGDGWLDGEGNEIADLCIQSYGRKLGGSGQSVWDESIDGGHYYLQELWSNRAGGCAARPRTDSDSFALPRGLSAGIPASLIGRGADRNAQVTGYQWTFGDGRSGNGRSVKHTYRRRGHYKVTLRTTDAWGNYSFYTRVVEVAAMRRKG